MIFLKEYFEKVNFEEMGGFAKYTYPQFQKSQEFAVDGGVYFDTLANSNESHAHGAFISAL